MLPILLLALTCQGNASAPPETLTLSGRVTASPTLDLDGEGFVVATGLGVADPARAPLSANGRFELTVQPSGGLIGLGCDLVHLYLDEPFLVDPDSPTELVLPTKYGSMLTVCVTSDVPIDETSEIQVDALRGERVVRVGSKQTYAEFPSESGLHGLVFWLKGLPPDEELTLRLRTPQFPDVLRVVPARANGRSFLRPGGFKTLSMHANEGLHVSGQIVDQEGQGIPFSSLRWESAGPWYPNSRAYHHSFTTLTDEEGRFSEVWHWSGPPTVRVQAEGFYSARFQPELGRIEEHQRRLAGFPSAHHVGQFPGCEWSLEPLPRINGQLLFPDGRPAASIRLRWAEWRDASTPDALQQIQSTQTTGDGSFELVGWEPGGDYRLLASAEQDDRSFQLDEKVLAGEQDELRFTLAPQIRSTLRVLDGSGEPIPRFRVHGDVDGRPSRNSFAADVEDNAGRFDFLGRERLPWSVSVQAEGYLPSERCTIDSSLDPQRFEIILLQESKLHCKILGPEGQQIDNATVFLHPADQAKPYVNNGAHNKAIRSVREDTGHVFSTVTTRSYWAWAEAPGYARSTLMEVALGPHETQRKLELLLHAPRTVIGRFHPDGEFPVTGWATLLSDETARAHTVRLDEQRSFKIEGLAPGSYELFTNWRSSASKSLGLIVVEEGADLDLLYGDPENDRFSCTLKLTYGGEPLSGAACRMITHRDGQEHDARTNEQGHAIFHPASRGSSGLSIHLAEFDYEVPMTWFLPPAEDYVGVVNVFPGEPHPVKEIDIPRGVVRGRVVYPNGDPAVDLDLRFHVAQVATQVGRSRRIRTGLDGEFLIAGVPGTICRIDVWPDSVRGINNQVFDGLEIGTPDSDSCRHELRLRE